jgi:hypothetical protein
VETGKIIGTNCRGELCFRGPLLMKGYMMNVEETSKAIDKDGWFHSGDLGYYNEDGYFYIVDRLKELIKYQGYQVFRNYKFHLCHKNKCVTGITVLTYERIKLFLFILFIYLKKFLCILHTNSGQIPEKFIFNDRLSNYRMTSFDYLMTFVTD